MNVITKTQVLKKNNVWEMFSFITSQKYFKVIIFVLFLAFLLFSRFYNLDHTARFIWDESSDLVKIHQYYVDKQITLVGPISEDGSKVFGSLTYYMLMPFAFIGNFDPISTAMGAAFWGTLTGLLFLYLVWKINVRYVYLVGLLILTWYPLLETSRWAWNPNFILFWIVLGLILYLKNTKSSLFLSGLSLGLAIHHHYLSLIAVFIFVFAAAFLFFRKKVPMKAFLLIMGFLTAILPFVIFDLRHPPGLFLSRIIYFNQINPEFSIALGMTKVLTVFEQMFVYFVHSKIIAVFSSILILTLLVWDLKYRKRNLLYSSAWISQLFFLVMLNDVYNHYFLPALPFFVVWLTVQRDRFGKMTADFLLFILILSSAFTIVPQLTYKDWQSDIVSTRKITDIIQTEIQTNQLQNVNLAVLSSPDPNTYGRRYRDLLLIRDVNLDSKYEYFTSGKLFVVSMAEEKTIREDFAPEMTNFRNGILDGKWVIPDSKWKIYLFNKGKI